MKHKQDIPSSDRKRSQEIYQMLVRMRSRILMKKVSSERGQKSTLLIYSSEKLLRKERQSLLLKKDSSELFSEKKQEKSETLHSECLMEKPV